MKNSHTSWYGSLAIYFIVTILMLMLSISTSALAPIATATLSHPVELPDVAVPESNVTEISTPVPAEPPTPPAPPTTRERRMQLALARICVSEAGFQVTTRDCELIYHVFRTRSRTGDLTLGIMRAYSSRSFDTTRTDRRRWVAHLNHEFREPAGWEIISVPWSARREGFRRVYEFAGQIIRSRPDNPCGVRLDHWGAQHFRRQEHLEDGWKIVQCGETLNAFWSLPERRPRVVSVN